MEKLLFRLLNNILETDVYCLMENDLSPLKVLEGKRNAYSLSLEIREESLTAFIRNMEDRIHYELVDNLGQRLFMFRFESATYIIGPYLKGIVNETRIGKILAFNNIPTQLLDPLKIQFFDLPIVDSYRIRELLDNIINSLYENVAYEYTYKKINEHKRLSPGEMSYENLDLSEKRIYEKYEAENSLLSLIEHGNVKGIRSSMEKMLHVNREEYLIAFHMENPQAAMASYRTLLRKAAERSGLPVPVIDRVISKYTQLMLFSPPVGQFNYLVSLSVELASEVRIYLMNTHWTSPVIKEVCEDLFVHYNHFHSIGEISKNHNISTSYLLHLFKKETGKTIYGYLEDIRLSRAVELLMDDYLSISEIANLVGYGDNNYFSRIFKRKYGVSPSAYKKTLHK